MMGKPSALPKDSAASASHSRVARGTVGRAAAQERKVPGSMARAMASLAAGPSRSRTCSEKSRSGCNRSVSCRAPGRGQNTTPARRRMGARVAGVEGEAQAGGKLWQRLHACPESNRDREGGLAVTGKAR